VLTQVVQELADIRIGFRQNRQAVTRADLGHDQQSSFVFQHRSSECPTASPQTEASGILRQGGGKCGERLGLERLMGGMLDGKSVGAQHQYCLDALPLNETAHDVSKTGHLIDLRGG
jgi:hypothetical protein